MYNSAPSQQSVPIEDYPPTYLRNIDHIALHNLEQCMLYTLTRNISADAYIPPTLANLVNLVNVHNATLATFQILSTLEVELHGINADGRLNEFY